MEYNTALQIQYNAMKYNTTLLSSFKDSCTRIIMSHAAKCTKNFNLHRTTTDELD